MQSVHVASIKDQSGYRTDQLRDIWDRSAQSSERSWMLPVGSKVSFLFHPRASEMLAKWPVDARTLAHLYSTNAKSFASWPLVWTGWRTYFGDRTTEIEIKCCGSRATVVRMKCVLQLKNMKILTACLGMWSNGSRVCGLGIIYSILCHNLYVFSKNEWTCFSIGDVCHRPRVCNN